MNQSKTPEEQSDFERRRTEFLNSYGKLVEEFKCDFLARPDWIPSNDQNQTWQFRFETQVVDTTNMSVVSPFQM